MDPEQRTPPLSREGLREMREMARHPADTPERHSLFERVRRRMQARREQEEPDVPWFLDGITVLSPEGSREVLDEIKNGTPLTPERAATFERARRMAGVRKRKLTAPDQHR